MSPIIALIQTFSISTSLLASGSILTLSLFSIPLLTSQPASRSLPQIRWLFSRGSHIFPQAAILSSAGFIGLAFCSLAPGQSATQILNLARNNSTANGYLAAAVLSFSIGPFTQFVMIPTNFTLIKKNEDLGGARSEKSANEGGMKGGKTAEESVEGKGDVNEFTDLSGPLGKTEREGTEEEERQVKELLGKFGCMNASRAALIGAGGLVGLFTALL
ncbi:hypothetical protein BKA65DRAFT_174381 [Rhexocercosporidium sp. MPI-PUGE-AT-0058]|nr:hypothetical protein BKA65DRAFT_174381 [Rhexocercosporidium sp. MPI-PUGE-AT-0058]